MPHLWVAELGQHWFRWWLVAFWAPSHYLSRWWRTVNWTVRNKFQCNLHQNLFVHENTFENVVRKKAAILLRGRWVNWTHRENFCLGLNMLTWLPALHVNAWVNGNSFSCHHVKHYSVHYLVASFTCGRVYFAVTLKARSDSWVEWSRKKGHR